METMHNKIKLEDIKLGMKFYRFKDNKEDEYDIYYVAAISRSSGITNNLIGLKTKDDEIDIVSYNDLINSDKYTLIDNYSIISLSIEKIKKDNRLIINLTQNNMVLGYYESTYKFKKSICDSEIDMTIELAMYQFTSSEVTRLISKIIHENILESRSIKSALYDEMNNIINKDDAIFTLLWNYVRFDNVPVNYIIGNKLSLKDYTTDYPDNVIPNDYMDYIIKNSNITKSIVQYKIFEYDESINFDNIKFEYLIIYSVPDDKFYLMLYRTGESLYKLNYETDEETKEVVDFMLRRHKK